MAMLAAALADPPESARKHVPHVPSGLAAVALRCLSKEPARRPVTYAQLRRLLAPYARQPVRPSSRAGRIRAAVVDGVLLSPILVASGIAAATYGIPSFARLAVQGMAIVVYFGWFEARYGASLGKALLKLRVVDVDGARAGIGRTTARAAIWACLPAAGALLRAGVPSVAPDPVLSEIVGFAVVFAVARRASGDRGLHELATGTRTIAVTAHREERPAAAADLVVPRRPAGGATTGGFVIGGRVWERDGEALDAAWDTALDRGVWIHHHEAGAAVLTEQRRSLARQTRLRWLASRRTQGECWDAFEAPNGAPLGTLTPNSALAMIIALSREFEQALADGTIIAPVTPAHVWIGSDGIARITEFPIRPDVSGSVTNVTDLASAERFLYALTVHALGAPLAGLRLPLSQRTVIDRLESASFASAREIGDAVETVRAASPRVSRTRRRLSLAGGVLLAVVMTTVGVRVASSAVALRARPDVDEAGRMLARLLYLEEPDESPGTQWMSRHPTSRYTQAQRAAFQLYVGTRFAPMIDDPGAWKLVERSWGGGDDLRGTARRARDAAATAHGLDRDRAAAVAAPVLDDLARRKAERGGFWLDLFYRLQAALATGLGLVAPWALFWSLLFRGSPLLRALGCGIAGPDGQRASWWRARLRSLLAWTPALAGSAPIMVFERADVHLLDEQSTIAVTNALTLGGFVLTLWRPEWAPQDRLAGTRIVPL
jgi:uncharacterized RDD family membrane protein YckC